LDPDSRFGREARQLVSLIEKQLQQIADHGS
jgi:hypothetical protein